MLYSDYYYLKICKYLIITVLSPAGVLRLPRVEQPVVVSRLHEVQVPVGVRPWKYPLELAPRHVLVLRPRQVSHVIPRQLPQDVVQVVVAVLELREGDVLVPLLLGQSGGVEFRVETLRRLLHRLAQLGWQVELGQVEEVLHEGTLDVGVQRRGAVQAGRYVNLENFHFNNAIPQVFYRRCFVSFIALSSRQFPK